jgi:HEAT repeat protein
LLSLCACGCADFWDEVTSRDFEFKSLYSTPNPLVVLRDSTDGDKRAKALRSLKEPKQNGGTDQEQEVIVKILTTAATTEKQPLCRLAAIESLSHFKDPRAAQALIDSFYNASVFTAETATVVRCQALRALGEVADPAARQPRELKARRPPATGPEADKQQALDIRIAAAAALGKFNEYRGTEALLRVLQTEKDVALRDVASNSLQLATGKKLGDDAKGWEEVLHQASYTEKPK